MINGSHFFWHRVGVFLAYVKCLVYFTGHGTGYGHGHMGSPKVILSRFLADID